MLTEVNHTVMNIEVLDNYLQSQDLHDNGCWRFLQKHKKAPVYSDYRKMWIWKCIDIDVLKTYGYNTAEKRSFLPHFLLRKVPQIYYKDDFFVQKNNFAIENGIYILLYTQFEEAYASVCKAWTEMKPVHRLFLSSVPKMEDIYN